MPYPQSFKYIIIGDQGVGKSCLLLQFTDSTFRTEYEITNGSEFGTRTITVDDKLIKLQIWDMAGQEAYRSTMRLYYRGAACIILVYDITRRESFDHIAMWLEEARKQSKDEITFLLMGNKCDLSNIRVVSYEEGQNFANNHNLVFMEASAKTAENVEKAFFETAEIICKNINDGVLDLSEKFIGFLHLPENNTLSESGGLAGSSCEWGERKRDTIKFQEEGEAVENIIKKAKT
ncbi:hypothetical protein ACQJBY_067640 [Aegilops geniculata]